MCDEIAGSAREDGGGGGDAHSPIVLTRSSPFVHNPHSALDLVVRAATGWSRGFRQITYYRPPKELSELGAMAYLVERLVAADSAEPRGGGKPAVSQVLVADWNYRLAQDMIGFLSKWPGLRKAEIKYAGLPRRARRAFAPLMIVDGSRPWVESYSFVRLVDRHFGRSARHLIALPDGIFGLGNLSPKHQFLFPQLMTMVKEKNLDGMILLATFPRVGACDEGNPEWQRGVSELRRTFYSMRTAFPGVSVLAAALHTDEAGEPFYIDRNPLMP